MVAGSWLLWVPAILFPSSGWLWFFWKKAQKFFRYQKWPIILKEIHFHHFPRPIILGIQFVSFQGCIFSKHKIIRSHLKAPFKRHFDDLALHPCPQNDSALLLPGLIGRLHRHHREVGILEARGSRWKVWRVLLCWIFGGIFYPTSLHQPLQKIGWLVFVFAEVFAFNQTHFAFNKKHPVFWN